MNPLAKIDRIRAQQAEAADAAILGLPTGPLQPGVRFEMDDIANWHDRQGGQHVHRLRLLCEATGLTSSGVAYRVVEIISEQDAPPPDVRRAPETGGIAHFAIPLYIESGQILILGPNPEVQP